MRGILLDISRLALLTFLVTAMLEVGLSLTLRQIIVPLRNLRLVRAALVANFLFVPLVAVGTARLFRLDEPFAIGLLLLGLAPGAPFLPKLVALAKGDVAFSVGLMVMLMAGTMVFLPLVLPQLLPGVSVGIWQIARPLLWLMVLPLSGGLLLKARFEGLADMLRPGLGWVANASLLITAVLVVGLNLPGVLKVFGSGAIGAAILFTALAGVAGFLVGGPCIPGRKVMALGTGFRNFAAALVVGEEDFRDPQVLVMLVVAALIGLLLLLPATMVWGNAQRSWAPP